MPAIAKNIHRAIHSPESSAIRKMFEEGIALKKIHGENAVFDFTLGNPCLEPPAHVLRAIAEVAADKTPHSHGYMPNAGFAATRAVIAQKIAREQGLPIGSIDGDSVVMTSGAAGALNCALKTFIDNGVDDDDDDGAKKTEVIVPSPFFAEYAHYAKNHGGALKPVPTKSDFSLDIAAIQKALSPHTACVIINSPNNPTGKIYSHAEIAALADCLRDFAASRGDLPENAPPLICDEPYREIVYDGASVPPVFPLYDNAIIVSSFAKDLSLAGERIGYIAVNPKMANQKEVVSALTFANRTLGYVNANAFFQRVIARAGETGALDTKPDFSQYERCRSRIMQILDKAGIEYAVPEGAFYVFCKVPPPRAPEHKQTDADFCAHLKKHLVLCAPGSGFGDAAMFRIAYCTTERVIRESEAAFLRAMAAW